MKEESNTSHLKRVRDKLLLGGAMLIASTTTAFAQGQTNSDNTNAVNKEHKIKDNTNQDLLYRILLKEFEESYKIVEQAKQNNISVMVKGVPQNGTLKDAVDFDGLAEYSAKNGVLSSETSTVQKTEDGKGLIAVIQPEAFFENPPEKPLVLDTRKSLNTEELGHLHAVVNFVMFISSDDENHDLLYHAADKLIQGEKLTKEEMTNINKLISNPTTSYAFYKKLQNQQE